MGDDRRQVKRREGGPRHFGLAAECLALAAVYYGAAKLGLSLAFETASVTAIWPPTGIALAALVLRGGRLWPGIALGAFLANSWTGVPLYAVLGITAGNTLEAVAGAYLLQRVRFRATLRRVRDVVALLGLAGMVSTTISATIGVGSLIASGDVDAANFGDVWRTWWLGDLGGDLVVAPAIMVAVTHWPYRGLPGRPAEAIAVAIAVLALSGLVFTESENLAYLIFPPLIWASLRFLQPGAVAATLLVAGVAIPLTEAEMGPFAGTPDERLLLAQTFVGTAGVTGLILAAITGERLRVEDNAKVIAETLQLGLLPPNLPPIAGVEAAVEFEPAGEGLLVGGDFYDWYEVGEGRWDVLVGDVRGKAATAARTTALARYTLRAEAIREARPSDIVARLNEAILRQMPDEVCTIAYLRLALDGGKARATVCLGGHPLPLVLRSGGEVATLGRPGSILGVPEPRLADITSELGPGDLLLLYTDGLTDAYAPERVSSPAEVAEALRSCAGLDPEETVRRIRTALLDGDREPRDDILLLALRVRPPGDSAPDG